MWKNTYRLSLISLFAAGMLGGCASYVPESPVSSPEPLPSVTPMDNEVSAYPAGKDIAAENAECGSRMPTHYSTKGENIVVVNPRMHAWGAYDKNGDLIKAGIACSGANWNKDTKGPTRTGVGTFRVKSLGSEDCVSSKYPKPHGGGPMPYCMFFNGGQALHGSPPMGVVDDNQSHGCVRMHVEDAEWLRYNFVKVGTKVVVLPY